MPLTQGRGRAGGQKLTTDFTDYTDLNAKSRIMKEGIQ
jgi:hypothetical protein